MANYAPIRTTYDTGDRRWLPDLLKSETHGVTLAGALFAGTIKSGTHIGVVTSAGATQGQAAPYATAAVNGLGVSVGHLLDDVEIKAGELHHVAVVHAGTVKTALLPMDSGHDAAAEADLTTIAYI